MAKRPMKFKTGGKVKRYTGNTDGSYVTGNVDDPAYNNTDSGEWARGENYGDGTTGDERVAMAKKSMPEATSEQMGKAYRDSLTFGNAFKDARESGLKTFDWRGKSYGTSIGNEKPVTVTKEKTVESVTAPKRMTTAEAMADLDKRTGVKPMNPNSDRGPNAVTGTDFSRNFSNTMNALTPLGGGVGKIGAELAMGSRAAKAAQSAEPLTRGREAVMNPLLWAQGPKALNAEQKAINAAGKAVRRAEEGFSPAEALKAIKKAENATGKTASTTARKKRLEGQIPDSVTNGGAIGYKKGGAVKKFAKGGSVSSASSRGDGIAIRGKTKGTISKMCGGGMYKGKK